MTTTTTPVVASLEENAQALIDARLDTIERMLMGQVSRGDRLAIVREVESQIHDLLADRNPNDTDRDAVIAVLARLDPPEAYLPDEAGEISRPAVTARRPRIGVLSPFIASHETSPPGTTVGKVSGILGIVSIVFLVLAGISFGAALNGGGNGVVYIFLGLAFLTLLIAVIAITLASYVRLKGAWSVVGLTTGIISFLCSLIGGLCGLM